MGLKAGDIVALKSGGQALTVAAVNGEDVDCIWIGEKGDLFRETLPLAVLAQVHIEHAEDDEDEDHDGDEDAEDDEEDEHNDHAHKAAEVA